MDTLRAEREKTNQNEMQIETGDQAMKGKIPMKKGMPATTIVIFGASGDLTWRKLIPALYNNFKKGRLAECATIMGFARRPLTDETFRAKLREGVSTFSPETFDPTVWDEFAQKVHYFQGDLDKVEDFSKLDSYLTKMEGRMANRLYYLATAPEHYPVIVSELGAAGMAYNPACWRRIVIEKPFGRDLGSALALNQAVHSVFNESQVYRIDHYLGQGDRPEYPVLPFCQHHLRTDLEPPLHQQRAGDGGRRCGCGSPGRILR